MQRKNCIILRIAECVCLAVLLLGGISLFRSVRHAQASVRPAVPLVVFALDSSCSMLASCGAGTRLSQAQKIIECVSVVCTDAEVSLVSFGGDAMVDFPPSMDREGFWDALNAIEPTLSFSPGSDPGSALRLAQQMAGGRPAVVVMVTDGELQIADESALSIWAERAIPLVWCVVGKGPAMPIPLGGSWLRDPDTGEVALSQADDGTMKHLASLVNVAAVQMDSSAEGEKIASALKPLMLQERLTFTEATPRLPVCGLVCCILGTLGLLGHLCAQARWLFCMALMMCMFAVADKQQACSLSANLSNRAADVYDAAVKAESHLQAVELSDSGIRLCVEALRNNPENSAARTNLQLFLKLRNSLYRKDVEASGGSSAGHDENGLGHSEKDLSSEKTATHTKEASRDMDDALVMGGDAGPARTVSEELLRHQQHDGSKTARHRSSAGSWRSIIVREKPMRGRKAGLKPW